jgi:hypothetical protein
MWRWHKLNRTSDVPDDLRANFEELGEPVVAQLVGRPYTQATPGVPAWAKNEADRRHALSWLSEKRRRANRKQWIGWSVGWFLSLVVIGFAVYNRWLAIQEDRPNFVTTGAKLYINHAGQPPPELLILLGATRGKDRHFEAQPPCSPSARTGIGMKNSGLAKSATAPPLCRPLALDTSQYPSR